MPDPAVVASFERQGVGLWQNGNVGTGARCGRLPQEHFGDPRQKMSSLEVRPNLGVLCRRLRYFRPDATLGEAAVALLHLRTLFRTLHFDVSMASLWAIVNGWFTLRRLSRAAVRCDSWLRFLRREQNTA